MADPYVIALSATQEFALLDLVERSGEAGLTANTQIIRIVTSALNAHAADIVVRQTAQIQQLFVVADAEARRDITAAFKQATPLLQATAISAAFTRLVTRLTP